jgi:hypothetical protein
MSRSVKVTKGLIVKQKEQERDFVPANNTFVQNNLTDEVKFIKVITTGNEEIPAGYSKWFPTGTVDNFHTITVKGILASYDELIVEDDGEIIIEDDGEVIVFG